MTREDAALLAMAAGAPAEVIAILARSLQERFAARRVRLLMVDYRLSTLQPVVEPAPAEPYTSGSVPVEGSDAGRAFASQQPSLVEEDDGFVLHLPVTVRGDRLGVLQVGLGAPPDAEQRDELAELATALGHALRVASRDTDLFELAARTQRLSLAAEMQWQLLPGRGCAAEHFVLAGQLEPAYHVAGDNFDWCSFPDHLVLSVTDGMGQGTAAALLTSLAVNALRNARRAGLGMADQASLADQALYANYYGERYVATLLLRLDHESGTATVVDAGSPLLLRQRDRDLELLELDKQLPMGMFGDTRYSEQRFQLAPGDRLVIVSDGVHEARSPRQEQFRQARLERQVRATRLLDPSEVARQLIRELLAHHESGALRDDAVVVCLDWLGAA